jgi:hypothetical protein
MESVQLLWERTILRNKRNQLDTHFILTYTSLRFKFSTCFRHYLPIFRRQYSNADLVAIVCGLHTSRDQSTSTTAQNSHQICVRVLSLENGQVMPEKSRLWALIKCKWKWSVYQVGCVYCVIMSLWYTVNKALKTRTILLCHQEIHYCRPLFFTSLWLLPRKISCLSREGPRLQLQYILRPVSPCGIFVAAIYLVIEAF